MTYANGNPVSVFSTAYFTGVFDDCPMCTLEYVISNVAQVWPTDPCPPLLCGTAGEHFDVCCIGAGDFRRPSLF